MAQVLIFLRSLPGRRPELKQIGTSTNAGREFATAHELVEGIDAISSGASPPDRLSRRVGAHLAIPKWPASPGVEAVPQSPDELLNKPLQGAIGHAAVLVDSCPPIAAPRVANEKGDHAIAGCHLRAKC